ncbi:TetR family transcriptional regulator [Acrocarpospora macrocephala]|uniref:Putative TetR family regulatory protein n=1 Tax=Acrocarpospora macrocephala TaxID=150177 RepID=A0A5M3WFJ6_9ACTN|nr:TetR/AcrR family transcriptional regulator [Acrocarpospora macrocephala]GES07109.1 putative TetR family regulatory protein [Acrocarpospora macrocephala]
MSIRNADATRQRILDAARHEFARYGVAGARVNRIAEAAECNKQLLYAYYGDKNALYAATREEVTRQTASGVPFDADDLPGYAGRLFDHHQRHPENLRLISWAQLEGLSTETVSPAGSESVYQKIAAIRAAQERGTVRADRSPEEILALVLKLSALGSPGSPESTYPGKTPADFRRLVVSAVHELVATAQDRQSTV